MAANKTEKFKKIIARVINNNGKFQCPECAFEGKSRHSVSVHIARKHCGNTWNSRPKTEAAVAHKPRKAYTKRAVKEPQVTGPGVEMVPMSCVPKHCPECGYGLMVHILAMKFAAKHH